MRNKYIRTLVCCFLISLASSSQNNKPVAVTQVPAPQQTVIAAPAAYPGAMKINYVRTKEAMGRYTDPETFDGQDYTHVKETTQYLDGLGRPLQTVVRQNTPGESPKDIVIPTLYDEFGRETYKYLPYVENTGSNSSNGAFKADPYNSQQNFYQSIYPTEQPSYSGEQFYYSKSEYDASPLNIVTKTMPQGNSWVGSGMGTQQKNLVNTLADDVKIWTITSNPLTYISNDVTTNLPSVAVNPYGEGQLYKNVTIDEQGNSVVEFKDKEGKVVLKKVQVGDIALDYSGYAGFLSTYYVYDDYNHLRVVIPPKAVEWLIANNWNSSSGTFILATLPQLCFRYEYDHRERMIAKKVPGTGLVWAYMVYDNRDRLVFSQDGFLRSKNLWMTTLYDELNRPVMTGLMSYTSGTAGDLQDYVSGLTETTSTKDVDGTTPHVFATTLDLSSYTENDRKATAAINLLPGFESGPQFSAEISADAGGNQFTNTITVMGSPIITGETFIPLTMTFYDDYQWTDKTYTIANNSLLQPGSNLHAEILPKAANNLVKGTVTGTKTRILKEYIEEFNAESAYAPAGDWLTTVNFYDDRLRTTQISTLNQAGGEDVSTNLYDFSGKVLSNLLAHNNPKASVADLKVLTNLEYDHAGRLLTIKKSINGASPILISENEYDMTGQLKTKKLGRKKDGEGSYTTDPLETLNYSYNIRGWLKGINKDYANAESGSDHWFGMDLSYDWGFDNNQLNGNIAGTKWRSKGDGEQRAYGFGYDKSNRILFADFNQNNSGWNKSASIDFSSIMGNGIDPVTAYDPNGNILAMKQWGLKGVASQVIDDLTYDYGIPTHPANLLYKVTESESIADIDNKLGDFTDKNRDGDDYNYNINGSLVFDRNKNLSHIYYNHLNLPVRIVMEKENANGEINYTYDATGNKLAKQVTDNTSASGTLVTSTDYISGFVYESRNNADYTLQFLSQEEGRIRSVAATPTQPQHWAFDYFIKDHLGNIRTVLTDEQQTDAYPAATMETAQATIEEGLYKNLNNTREDKPEDYPTDNYTDPNDKVAKVRGDGNKIGPSIMLKVMAGDKFNVRASSWYKLNNIDPGTLASPLDDIVATLINGIPAISGDHVALGELTTTIMNPNVNDYLQLRDGENTYTEKPKAYINAVLLDDQFKPVNTNDGKNTWFEQVGDDGELKIHLLEDREITKNGYLYIYTSNETENIAVFFDNLQVTHIRGPLLEETHYYPFGLTMSGISSKALKNQYVENKHKFNDGTELNTDLDLNWYDTDFRSYDPQLGRFWQMDELAEFEFNWSPFTYAHNNPILLNDPTGLLSDSLNPVILPPVVITSTKKRSSVGQPGLAESLIPVWGSGRAAIDDFQNGRWGWGIFNGVMAITDVFLVKSAVTAIGKLFVKEVVQESAKEGVYLITTSSGRYIGQSSNFLKRLIRHFGKGGKLSGQQLEKALLHEMPGSTKIEREVYEQYLIDKNGLDNLLNAVNPMGGRREIYNKMVDVVIEKFGLPK